MIFTQFDFASLPVSRWRNGGGETREIACCPSATEDFSWRVSIATIAQDGPFSAFPGIDRSITLLEGEGVDLLSEGQRLHRLSRPWQPFAFSGDQPLQAKLLGGSSQDFNLMTRRGTWQAEVRLLQQTQLLPSRESGVIYLLRGEWQLTISNRLPQPQTLSLQRQQGVWWADTAVTLHLLPQSPDAALLWADLQPV